MLAFNDQLRLACISKTFNRLCYELVNCVIFGMDGVNYHSLIPRHNIY